MTRNKKTGITKLSAGLAIAFAAVFATLSPVGGILGAYGQEKAAQPEEQESAPEFVQMKLTDKHLKAFIGAQGDLADISKRLEAAGGKEDPKLDAEVEALAKKHGFESFEQLEDVASNILFVLDVTDPKTGKFSDPKVDIKEEMGEVKADKKLSAEDKKKALAHLEADLLSVPALKYKENIAVVNRHRATLVTTGDKAGDKTAK